MGAWQLDDAKTMLQAWLEAEMRVTKGQSYRIGSKELTRADLSLVAERIDFWRREVARLEQGRKGLRTMRVVPRDL